MYIAISGNIGSGKTTLTQLLAQHYHWQARFEAVDYNPYLEDYYGNIPRWSFNLEVYFLKERFKDLLAIAKSPIPIVQDRSIFEGVHIFTACNYESGALSERDYHTYLDLFEQMMSVAKLPDLMIYLRADVPYLIRNIQQRGRDYERQMPLDYLARLNDKYEDFIQNKYLGRVLILDKAQYDFTKPTDMLNIYDRIDAALGTSDTLAL
jgi:deoxyadenosine/deoxycytidine kinase